MQRYRRRSIDSILLNEEIIYPIADVKEFLTILFRLDEQGITVVAL